ncbi:MAG: DNA translocase FtsK [Ilumatobacteraceae bacterium]|nr:DNA translocase FtsK [Ilumatobacteraceae bacterium]
MSKQASRPRSSSGKPAGRDGASAGKKRDGNKDAPRPREHDAPRPREHAAVRAAVGDRENEFRGIAIVVAGVLAALGVYLNVAGPVGDAIDTALGWVLGVGRFLLPPALVAVGVVVVRRNESEHRLRIAVGSVVIVLASLGLMHLARGEGRMTADVDALKPAGGWIGALIGQPLRTMLSIVGATVVLLAVALGGVLIVTGMSLPLLVRRLRTHFATVAVPTARAAKKVLSDIKTTDDFRRVDDAPSGPVFYDHNAAVLDPGLVTSDEVDTSHVPAFDPGAPRPALYDFEMEEGGNAKPTKPRRKPAQPATEPEGEFPPRPKNAGRAAEVVTTPDGDELALGPAARRGSWALPPANLLSVSPTQAVDRAAVEERGHLLESSLASHGVDTRLVGMTVGPTVTRYELELGSGVKVARVTSLDRDIAYAMAATDVRILAPIPGRSAIGVEVPNTSRQLVSLGDLMTSPEAKAATHPLDVAVGKDIAGRAVFMNLATTPHLLIAGATGAGKSSGLNCIITSILMRTTPDQVRLILIDPKQVEMGQYGRLPHLLTQPVTNPKKAANALGWAVKEMERRYDLLVEVGFRDITGYNAAYDRGDLVPDPGTEREFERLPYIVVVVDELNDLMMVAARDVEDSITRIAQKARAVGIHLIIATQRPSVNVITGVIKANIPARMAFAVSSLTDSRVILDRPGAEKLVGKGDMLLLPGNTNVAQRVQGSWVTEEEVRAVVAHWRRQAPEVVYVSGIDGEAGASGSGSGLVGGTTGDEDDDDLLKQAIELVVTSGLGSTSMLQRKLKVGFARAGRLMDLLEERGIVGPGEGSKARQVLMSPEEYAFLQQSN